MTLLDFCGGDRELAALLATNIRRSFLFAVVMSRDERLYLAYKNARRMMAERDAGELLAVLDRALAGKVQ